MKAMMNPVTNELIYWNVMGIFSLIDAWKR
jgi:hypothetical protein